MHISRTKLHATAGVHAKEFIGGIKVVKQHGCNVLYYADTDSDFAEIVKTNWTLAFSHQSIL